ncbi:MAG: hypothetical protein AABZ84_02950 [Pseudomonadota bacterium]
MTNSAGAVNLLPPPRLLSLEVRRVLKQLIHKYIEQRRTATLSPGPSPRPFSLEGRGVLKQLIQKGIEQRRTATYSFLPSPLVGEGSGERGRTIGSKR